MRQYVIMALALILLGCSTGQGQKQEQKEILVSEETTFVSDEIRQETRGDDMPSSSALSQVKWFGHASFMFTDKISGNRIYYIDSFDFSDESKEKADIIFITHAHPDHCDPDSVKKIMKPNTVIVVPSGCKLGITADFVDVAPNKEYDIKGFKFRTVPAYNVKPDRLKYHPRSNNWVGYVFYLNNKTVYHAGDTDFIEEMKQLGKINVALLPIGGTYTMDVDEAIDAANAIKADVTVPMHYRRLLGNSSSSAEEKFEQGVKSSKVVILDEVA